MMASVALFVIYVGKYMKKHLNFFFIHYCLSKTDDFLCNFYQAAFLSALAGVEVAEAAARAAVTTQSEVDNRISELNLSSLVRNTKHQGMIKHNSQSTCDPSILFFHDELEPKFFVSVEICKLRTFYC